GQGGRPSRGRPDAARANGTSETPLEGTTAELASAGSREGGPATGRTTQSGGRTVTGGRGRTAASTAAGEKTVGETSTPTTPNDPPDCRSRGLASRRSWSTPRCNHRPRVRAAWRPAASRSLSRQCGA